MASVNTEIKLDDEYITSQGKLIAEWTEDIQKGVDEYIRILDSIVEDAIMEGTTAEALKSFAGYAENLKAIISSMGTEAKGMCVNFLAEVDEADSYLY